MGLMQSRLVLLAVNDNLMREIQPISKLHKNLIKYHIVNYHIHYSEIY